MVAVQDTPLTEERMQTEENSHLLLPNLKKLGWGWGMGCQVIGRFHGSEKNWLSICPRDQCEKGQSFSTQVEPCTTQGKEL